MKKQEQQNNYVPSKYSKDYNNYARSQLKSVLPILRSVAHSCNNAFRYPIYKVLKAIAKIFLMNQVEGIFFAYMIKQTNWDIKDRLITQNSDQVRDVVCYNSDQPQYKNVILYLMLVTYTIKFYMNQNTDELLEEAIRICPNFKLIFQNWTKKHSSLTTKISPKTLNRVYQDLWLRIRHEEPDYHLLTDAILQISPAYNSQKSDKDKRMESKEEKKEIGNERNEGFEREKPMKMVKVEQELHFQQNPIFSSSRLYEMAGVGLNHSQCSNFQVFGYPHKNGNNGIQLQGSVFGSSAIVGMPMYPIKDEDDYCQELNLGLQDGQSEQNINLRETFPEIPQTSIFSLKRGFSGDRYLNFQGNDP